LQLCEQSLAGFSDSGVVAFYFFQQFELPSCFLIQMR
jgi:hypothetical protein